MKKPLIILVSVFIAIFVFAKFANVSLEKAVSKPNSDNSQAVYFSINPGQDIRTIGNNLEKAGIINSSGIFARYAKKIGVDKKVKAGEYTLDSSMSTKQVLSMLVSGEMEEIWFTIPEGWRIDQIASHLESEGIISAKEFENRAKVKYFLSYPFLSGLGGNISLEGYLFPDTYRIFVGSTAQEIIERMLDNFGDKVTANMMDGANRLGFSLHEFITLASIVEKESAHSLDIRKISSVYHNRLRDGMLLQSDATITYITGRPDARPTFDETRVDSPYNTYINPGLPPGPIGNPGMTALESTLNPESTNYYFFVSRGDRAYFATTYEEHLRNISIYLNS